ncbi:MAG TPA: hypothetical protein VGU74_14400 [Gemmatimonadales bacterium]|nr:hypothetical protein [Gemmatimonadales bacterium]
MSGRVLRGGRDTVPLPHASVILHRITRTGGGPIDSSHTDARGRYRFAIGGAGKAPDTSSIYVVSAWYDSLAYFSLPVNLTGGPVAHVDDIVAYPTTVNTPPIRLERRLATVASAGTAGTREVLEILELENTGATTRITKDTLFPTWAGRVPYGVGQLRVGQGDVSPDAMLFRHDSVFVLGPVPPGPVKQLSYAYTLPAGLRALAIPIDQPTENLNLLIEDTVAVVTAPRLASLGVQQLEGHYYAAYRAGPLMPDDRVEIQLPAGKFRAQTLLPYVIAVVIGGMVLALVLALVWALRKRQPPA